MKMYKAFIYLVCALGVASLYGCGGGGDSETSDSTSTNFPYLITGLRVTSIQNVNLLDQYDVTVEADVDGPTPIYSVNLWIFSENDTSVFDSIDLQPVGGTTWSATTNTWLPLPAGNYYIDSIMIEDGDSFLGGQVRSGWYTINDLMSGSHYYIDQRLTDWDTVDILDFKVGVSNIPIAKFTLPQQ